MFVLKKLFTFLKVHYSIKMESKQQGNLNPLAVSGLEAETPII
jgi:hypothetical protein